MSERQFKVKVDNESSVGWIVVAIVLVFLFEGKPDVWDALHAAAMRLL